MMKKIVLLTIVLFIIGWGILQLIITPWGNLSGKIVFNTTRMPLSGKETLSTVILQDNKSQVIFKGRGLYKYRWSPDGKKIAAFSGHHVVLIDEKGNVLRSIGKLDETIGMDLTWFPNNNQVLAIEHSGSVWDGTLPQRLFIYDFSRGERMPFYINDDYNFYDIAISETGQIIFAGRPAGKERQNEAASLYEINSETKKISFIKKTTGSSFTNIDFIGHGKKLVFFGNFKPFGCLISPWALGVYDLKTGFTRYISLWAGDIRQMTVVEDGKYLVTAEGEGNGVVLYKRSLLGGFKLPVMKPEKLAHLNGFPSQDQYPDWHA